MGRWEPNARERLVYAAVDLFSEQGYDATTVSQIAERAGELTKTTFFRYFPDKREVLFAGQEVHRRILADAIAAAPDSATPLQALAAALDALAATFTDDRRAFCARLQAVMDGSSELQERAAAKHAALAGAMTEALPKRGVPDPAAGLGARAFYQAFNQWAASAGQQTLAELARRTLDDLRAVLATLG
jgi:AcrR family transcriptional regulator